MNTITKMPKKSFLFSYSTLISVFLTKIISGIVCKFNHAIFEDSDLVNTQLSLGRNLADQQNGSEMRWQNLDDINREAYKRTAQEAFGATLGSFPGEIRNPEKRQHILDWERKSQSHDEIKNKDWLSLRLPAESLDPNLLSEKIHKEPTLKFGLENERKFDSKNGETNGSEHDPNWAQSSWGANREVERSVGSLSVGSSSSRVFRSPGPVTQVRTIAGARNENNIQKKYWNALELSPEDSFGLMEYLRQFSKARNEQEMNLSRNQVEDTIAKFREHRSFKVVEELDLKADFDQYFKYLEFFWRRQWLAKFPGQTKVRRVNHHFTKWISIAKLTTSAVLDDIKILDGKLLVKIFKNLEPAQEDSWKFMKEKWKLIPLVDFLNQSGSIAIKKKERKKLDPIVKHMFSFHTTHASTAIISKFRGLTLAEILPKNLWYLLNGDFIRDTRLVEFINHVILEAQMMKSCDSKAKNFFSSLDQIKKCSSDGGFENVVEFNPQIFANLEKDFRKPANKFLEGDETGRKQKIFELREKRTEAVVRELGLYDDYLSYFRTLKGVWISKRPDYFKKKQNGVRASKHLDKFLLKLKVATPSVLDNLRILNAYSPSGLMFRDIKEAQRRAYEILKDEWEKIPIEKLLNTDGKVIYEERPVDSEPLDSMLSYLSAKFGDHPNNTLALTSASTRFVLQKLLPEEFSGFFLNIRNYKSQAKFLGDIILKQD